MILPFLGAAFAAFIIWLAVRIVNRRERWAKRTAMAFIILAMYPLTYGPACWLLSRSLLPRKPTIYVYMPLIFVEIEGPEPMKSILEWYHGVLAPIPIDITL